MQDAAEPVSNAVLFGSRQALKYTAIVPLTMALLYLLMILGFKAKGGYKILGVDEHHYDEDPSTPM